MYYHDMQFQCVLFDDHSPLCYAIRETAPQNDTIVGNTQFDTSV